MFVSHKASDKSLMAKALSIGKYSIWSVSHTWKPSSNFLFSTSLIVCWQLLSSHCLPFVLWHVVGVLSIGMDIISGVTLEFTIILRFNKLPISSRYYLEQLVLTHALTLLSVNSSAIIASITWCGFPIPFCWITVNIFIVGIIREWLLY